MKFLTFRFSKSFSCITLHLDIRYYVNIIYYLPNQHNFRFVNIETAETDGFLGNWIDEIKRNQLFTFRKKSIKIVDNVLFKKDHSLDYSGVVQ